MALFGSAQALEIKKASELIKDISPEQQAVITEELVSEGIAPEDLDEVEVSVDPETKTIDITGPQNLSSKHAAYIALRVGFPLLAGIGVVYRHEGDVDFNVTLNAQTVILASSYNAGVAWNFFRGFFVGATAHLIHRQSVWTSPDKEFAGFYGPQFGYQHSFGKNKRWYIDGRGELLITEDNVVPNANIGFGIRFW